MINYSLTLQKVGTGSSYSALPEPDHAKQAVQRAMANMESDQVGSVLLFLSGAYAHAPQEAIKHAVRAAGTPQVFGCTALNLLTEDEWLMDVEGAVAMTFPTEFALQPLKVMERLSVKPSAALTLASPNAAEIAMGSTNEPQFGAVTSDEFGHGPYSIWQSGRIEEHEFSLTGFPHDLEAHVVVADGVKHLSEPLQINLAVDHELVKVGEKTAFASLPEQAKKMALKQPFNLLCAVSESADVASLEQGCFTLHHVVGVDQGTGRIQLSGYPKAGRHLLWAVRDAADAESSMQRQLLSLKQNLDSEPLFALMFPNISRGAEFYGGKDLDLDSFQGAFGDTPLIGFYGNGEITPGFKQQGLLKQHSTLLAVFTEKG